MKFCSWGWGGRSCFICFVSKRRQHVLIFFIFIGTTHHTPVVRVSTKVSCCCCVKGCSCSWSAWQILLHFSKLVLRCIIRVKTCRMWPISLLRAFNSKCKRKVHRNSAKFGTASIGFMTLDAICCSLMVEQGVRSAQRLLPVVPFHLYASVSPIMIVVFPRHCVTYSLLLFQPHCFAFSQKILLQS